MHKTAHTWSSKKQLATYLGVIKSVHIMSLSKFGTNKYINFFAYSMMIVGTIGFIFFLVKKVDSGSGLDHYISMAGYDLSYLQALMMFGSMPFVVILAEIVSHYLGKDERDFIKKYDIKDE